MAAEWAEGWPPGWLPLIPMPPFRGWPMPPPLPPPFAFLLAPNSAAHSKANNGPRPPGPFIPPNNASNWGMQKRREYAQLAKGIFYILPNKLIAPNSSIPLPPEEIVIERKGASVGSGPSGSGPGGTPSKRGSGKKGPNGAHSLASPSPPPPPIQSSQPSLADRGEGEDHQKDYRVAMFGGGGVGKSALVQRFIKNTFSDAYLPTIEDTYQQVITCSEQGRMAVCTLHIIDTTGSHQFPAMQRLAIQRGHAFILVYSITSRQSLEELGPIVRTLREVKGEGAMGDVPIVLVGNKMDEQGRREVNRETGEALAQRWGCEFVETSAKQGRNVTELFQRLLSLEKRRHLRLAVQDSDGGEKEGGAGGMQELNCAKQRKCAII